MYATQVSVDASVHMCKHTPRRVCTYAHVCAVCSLALRDESGRFQPVYAGHFLLVWGVIFDKRKDRGVVCIFLYFLTGVGMYVDVRVCVYAHMHTHYTWSTRMWAQGSGRDTWRAWRIQMDYILTYMFSYMCTKYTCVYMLGWDLGLTAFSWTYTSLRKRKAKDVNVIPRTRIHDLSYTNPQSRVLAYCLK